MRSTKDKMANKCENCGYWRSILFKVLHDEPNGKLDPKAVESWWCSDCAVRIKLLVDDEII